MAEQQKESSVLFSLKELMGIEEERIKEEEADRAARAKSEREAREAEERRRRDEEERRVREEEERRRTEEQRKREESTRLDAIRHAELEKAKAEAEHKARLESMTAQQAHEAQLASITHDQSKKKLQMAVGIVAFLLIAGGTVLGLALKKSSDEATAKAQALEAERRAFAEEKARLERQMQEAEGKETALRSQLSNAKDEADRARIEKELRQAQQRTAAARQNVGRARPAGGGDKPATAKPACNCTPGDPLCSCL